MSIAVTGATGLLGGFVIDGLLQTQEPASIVAIIRDAGKAQSLADRGVQVRVASYTDPTDLEIALQDVDKLLLISGSEVGQRIDQHTNVVNASRDAGVKHIFYTSAPHADTSKLVLVPEHKATEAIIRESGIPFTFLRNNWYTENYVQNLEQAKRTGMVVAAAGKGRVASASRTDYAAGAVAALIADGQEGKVYEFSGDVAWDFNDLAAAIGEIIGKPVVYQAVTPDELVTTLTGAGLPEQTAQFVAALDAGIAEGFLGEATNDLSTLIGRPTTPLVDGLRAAAGA